MTFNKAALSGWGNTEFQNCVLAEAASESEVKRFLDSNDVQSWIPRGLGRSFGDCALNRAQGVLSIQNNQQRIGPVNGGIVECDAAISIKNLIDHLLPGGHFLPVTPGTKNVTIGGAIAADVHGKNQFAQGSFGNHVNEITLLTASSETLRCSPGEHADLFRATIGGMGLTGLVLKAKLRVSQIDTAYMHVAYRQCSDLDATMEWMEEAAMSHEQVIAWIDMRAPVSQLGKSIVMAANSASCEQLPKKLSNKPMALPRFVSGSVPCFAPTFLINRTTCWLLNSLYSYRHRSGERLVHLDDYYYPQDRLNNWNRLYGRRGLIDYQALFPLETSRSGLIRLLETLKAERLPIPLAVLKLFGKKGAGLLSFCRPGFTLGVDFPHDRDSSRGITAKMDAFVLKHGGRLYLAKDALMQAETFHEMYPELEEFRSTKTQVDPEFRFLSSQSRRLRMFPDAS